VVRRETGQEVAGVRRWECWPAAGGQHLKTTCENAGDWPVNGWSGRRGGRGSGTGAPRWTVSLLLVMWVESEPGRGVGVLSGESTWRCALHITTDVAVKFLPL